MLLAANVIPLVNQKYKYILLYSAKAGCTSLRSLYLSVHHDEMSETQLASLDWYHNLNEVQPFDSSADYSDYYVYCVTRNPYSRVVSAFLDQYAYACNAGVEAMMDCCPPIAKPQNFIEFLEYLASVPDAKRDTHFQTQSYFPYADMVVTPKMSIRYRLLGQKPAHAFGINLVGDIATFNTLTRKVFKQLFRNDKSKHKQALDQLKNIKRKNSSFYSKTVFPTAASLSLPQLDSMVLAPKPKDFYAEPRAIELVDQIYQDDFFLFGYTKGEIPHKSASKEIRLVPDDFDWQMYLRLNPDLPLAGISNQRSVIRHYLEFGQFEAMPRAYKIKAPLGFDWQRYLDLNTDLEAEGIATEAAAIEHYISYGIRQHRRIS
ncbi:MAG: hypothetical protein ACJAQ6_001236 [Arenicella sp.]